MLLFLTYSVISTVIILHSVCGIVYSPQFSDYMQNVTAERGEDTKFVCNIKHVGRNKVAFLKLDPPTLLTWQHKIFASRPHKYRLENPSEGSLDKWTLHVHSLENDDAGLYMCQVGTSPMISQTAFLFLRMPPKINPEKTTHDMVVMENYNATLVCVADGSPPPVISWQREDGQPIITNEPVGFGVDIIYKSNLTIYKVGRNHMTVYVCKADNGVVPTDGWNVKLHVHFPPTVYAMEQRVIGYLTYDVKLQCKADAWPRPDFKWYFRGSLILTNSTKYQTFFDTNSPYLYESLSAFNIRNLHINDFGAYYCVAKNDYGEATATVELIRKDFFIERPMSKQKNKVENKLASLEKNYVADDVSGSGELETLSDDDDYTVNLTAQFEESKDISVSDNDNNNDGNEVVKPREKPSPPDIEESDDKSPIAKPNSRGGAMNSSRNFSLFYFYILFLIYLL